MPDGVTLDPFEVAEPCVVESSLMRISVISFKNFFVVTWNTYRTTVDHKMAVSKISMIGVCIL